MNDSSLKQGQSLAACYGPESSEGNFSGWTVGHKGVIMITVGQLRGPMGFYDVAIIKREGRAIYSCRSIWRKRLP